MTSTAAEIRTGGYTPSFGQPNRTPGSQATAIEQARVTAEVQAQVVVAKNCKRDEDDAIYAMRRACSRTALAEKAFYAVPNRGTGPSVHLMRELARCWGNIQHGSKELSRDDVAGVSEVEAYCWDMQGNTRTNRHFITPHERMKQGSRQRLTDLTDIQNNNNGVAGRAVRECIAYMLPRWFIDEAVQLCRQTLENGEGVPLQERIDIMVDWFGKMGITIEQIEQRLDKRRGKWTAEDVAEMKIAGQSIKAGEATKDELFPKAANSTAMEIAGYTGADQNTPEPEPATAPAAREKPKRTRRTKAEIAADREAAEQADAAKRGAPEADTVAAAIASDQAEGDMSTTPGVPPASAPGEYVVTSVVDGPPTESALIDFGTQPGDAEPEQAAQDAAIDAAMDAEQEPPGGERAPGTGEAGPVIVDETADGGPIRGDQMGKLFSLRSKFTRYASDSVYGNKEWARLLSEVAMREVKHAKDLTAAEAGTLIDVLEAELA